MANGSSNATVDFASANGRPTATSNAILVLEPTNGSFALKSLELPENTRVKIGRQTGVTTAPNPSNGYFDSKVLSRVHAEVWSENSKVYIRDLKSSNGTFLNGKRLCPENVESEPFVLNQNDHLEFGIDIMDEDGSYIAAREGRMQDLCLPHVIPYAARITSRIPCQTQV
ncbi:SMAD/FHA domain-containing protein [Gamsiella multidivaricata]|uniref:SMAD/FHA domain-containing protein n=1 Tax=Gamsiella multidivaricata TaxID=101098 RepID=UPI00221EC350|nr:SMAD/FHA domain-containing protein [Gamsiella multidivaricata]KAI7818204.1 SMAD/FHA domain-containing protein [Gamsiella multidivaricata]